jgi:two-component system OmpR family response regulator
MKIMVVEDDRRTSDYVRQGLMQAGHVVDVLEDGRDALAHGSRSSFDVIIVDRLLPGPNGLLVVKALRAAGNTTPVLFLTAVNGVDDRVEGLESGGDDYLVKPFAFSELMARVNALGRRPPAQTEKTVLQVGDLELDLVRRACRRGDTPIDLLPREFALLEYLISIRRPALSRRM